MQRLLILGAGTAQIPLIQTAKKMGLTTVVASIPGAYPGFAEADIISYTDITDAEAVLAVAREYQVSGVVTCGFEIGLMSLAYTCKEMKLAGPTIAAAEISTDKLLMKQAFERERVTTAPYTVLRSVEDVADAAKTVGFPMVIKAVDLQGSQGIAIVHDEKEARKAAEESFALSHKDYILAEAYLTGENIGAEAFVQNGKISFVLPDGTISYSGRVNVPVGHYVPLNCSKELINEIQSTVERAIVACGFDNCAVNVDLIINNGVPYVVELTARAGATCLPETVSIYYGINYYEMIISAAMGWDTSGIFNSRHSEPCPNISSMLMSDKDGIVKKLCMPETLPENVYDLHFIVNKGDHVRKFSGTIDRIGQIIVSGKSLEDCKTCMDRVLSEVRVEVE